MNRTIWNLVDLFACNFLDVSVLAKQFYTLVPIQLGYLLVTLELVLYNIHFFTMCDTMSTHDHSLTLNYLNLILKSNFTVFSNFVVKTQIFSRPCSNVTSRIRSKIAILTGNKLSYQDKFKCNSSHLIFTSKSSQLYCPSKHIYNFKNLSKMFDNN